MTAVPLMGRAGHHQDRRWSVKVVRILAGRCKFTPRYFAIRADLRGREGQRRAVGHIDDPTTHNKFVVVEVLKLTAGPDDFHRPFGHRGAKVVVGLIVRALLTLQIPSGLRHRLCGDEAVGELNRERVRRLAIAAVGHTHDGFVHRAGFGIRLL